MTPSVTVTTTEQHPFFTLRSEGLERIKFDGTDRRYGDWQNDLILDGHAIIRGAVPGGRALSYANRMYGLVESL